MSPRLEMIITDPDIAIKRVVAFKPDQCPFKSLGVDCKNKFYVLRSRFSGRHEADVEIFHLCDKRVRQYITSKALNIVRKNRHMSFLQLSIPATRALTQIDLKFGDPSTWLIETDQTFFQWRKIHKLLWVTMLAL